MQEGNPRASIVLLVSSPGKTSASVSIGCLCCQVNSVRCKVVPACSGKPLCAPSLSRRRLHSVALETHSSGVGLT